MIITSYMNTINALEKITVSYIRYTDCHTKFINTHPNSTCSMNHLSCLENKYLVDEWDKILRDKELMKLRESVLDKQEGGNHYKHLVIQPVEYIVKNKIPFCEGNIIKYVTRHKDKNGIEDLRKAKHMLELIAELEYGEVL